MRLHFISRLALLLMAGFGIVATQVWTPDDTLQWLFAAGGAIMIVAAAVDAAHPTASQRALDGLIALLGAWTIVQAFAFSGDDLKWWSFASAGALAVLSTIGLIIHEQTTERVVHELSVTARAPRQAAPTGI